MHAWWKGGIAWCAAAVAVACGGKTTEGSGTMDASGGESAGGVGSGGESTAGGGTSSGGAASRDPVSIDSGLPPDVLAMNLSEADAVRLCEASLAASDRAITDRDYCTMLAVADGLMFVGGSTSLDPVACHTFVQGCLEDGRGTARGDCADAEASVADCDVTVAEFERCFDAQLAQVVSYLEAMSCDDPPDYETLSNPPGAESVPECRALDQRCPALF